MPPEIRVLVIADDPLARAGLAALLASENSLSIVGQLAPRSELLSDLAIYQPELLLWDLGWASGPISERLADVAESHYLVLALVTDQAQAAEAWFSGARGVLPRDSSGPVLIAALHAIAQGLTVLSPDFRDAVARPREMPSTPLLEPLTAREMEVLRLMAEGLANKAISYRLEISEHTVKFHVNAILGKLGAQSRTEAVTLAIRRGLVHL